MKRAAERLVQHAQADVSDLLPTPVPQRPMAQLEPVKRLMLAVLECAVNDLRTYAVVPTGRGRRIFAEIDSWFHSSTGSPFDFETICQATDLDPDFIRKGLRSSYAAGCRQPSISVAPKAKIAAPSARYPRPRERFRRTGAATCDCARAKRTSRARASLT
jgi:hypothetical protein